LSLTLRTLAASAAEHHNAAVESLKDPADFMGRYFSHLQYLRWYREEVDPVIDQYQYLLFLVHPGSGKSTRISFLETIKAIAKDRTIPIGYASRTADKAENYMTSVGTALKTNERLIRDFGFFYDPHDPSLQWSQKKIRVVGSADKSTPTLTNFGRGSQYESLRLKLLILDDFVDLKVAESPADTEKADRQLDALKARLDDDGRLIMLGHLFLKGDLYDDLEESRPEFKVIRLPAIYPDGRLLAPELWTERSLRYTNKDGEWVKKYPDWVWECWYMQRSTSPDSCTFSGIPRVHIRDDLIPEDLGLVAFFDPAYSEGARGDWSVGLAGGRHGGRLIITDIADWRIKAGWAPRFCEWAADVGARTAYPEDNNAKTLPPEMSEYCREHDLPLSVKAVTTRGKKEFRIGNMTGPAADKRILFAESLKGNPAFGRLVRQWDLWPNVKHDDHIETVERLWSITMIGRKRRSARSFSWGGQE
jgi:hypothetical protein